MLRERLEVLEGLGLSLDFVEVLGVRQAGQDLALVAIEFPEELGRFSRREKTANDDVAVTFKILFQLGVGGHGGMGSMAAKSCS